MLSPCSQIAVHSLSTVGFLLERLLAASFLFENFDNSCCFIWNTSEQETNSNMVAIIIATREIQRPIKRSIAGIPHQWLLKGARRFLILSYGCFYQMRLDDFHRDDDSDSSFQWHITTPQHSTRIVAQGSQSRDLGVLHQRKRCSTTVGPTYSSVRMTRSICELWTNWTP